MGDDRSQGWFVGCFGGNSVRDRDRADRRSGRGGVRANPSIAEPPRPRERSTSLCAVASTHTRLPSPFDDPAGEIAGRFARIARLLPALSSDGNASRGYRSPVCTWRRPDRIFREGSHDICDARATRSCCHTPPTSYARAALRSLRSRNRDARDLDTSCATRTRCFIRVCAPTDVRSNPPGAQRRTAWSSEPESWPATERPDHGRDDGRSHSAAT